MNFAISIFRRDCQREKIELSIVTGMERKKNKRKKGVTLRQGEGFARDLRNRAVILSRSDGRDKRYDAVVCSRARDIRFRAGSLARWRVLLTLMPTLAAKPSLERVSRPKGRSSPPLPLSLPRAVSLHCWRSLARFLRFQDVPTRAARPRFRNTRIHTRAYGQTFA